MPRKIAVHRTFIKSRTKQALVPKKTRNERGYDGDWYKLQKAFLAAHPLCQCNQCKEGEIRLVRANVVNHIVDIRDRPDLRLSWDNLQSMNKRCHDRHTRIKMNEQMRDGK